MSTENANQPIYPVVKPGFVYADGSHEESSVIANGLTKREYFAAMALQGLLANSYQANDMDRKKDMPVEEQMQRYAKGAVMMADELLNQLK